MVSLSFSTLLFMMFIYFLPALVALSRRHNNVAAIVLLNFFLGWTVIGWIAALIWSATDNVAKAGLQKRLS